MSSIAGDHVFLEVSLEISIPESDEGCAGTVGFMAAMEGEGATRATDVVSRLFARLVAVN